YQNDIDWSGAPPLQAETFTTQSEYDAVNRPVRIVAPHNNAATANIFLPGYNEGNLLETVDVQLRGSAARTDFVTDIDYNEKGQRERIEYANGTATLYKYDKNTFRLIALITARDSDPELFWDDR